MASLKSSKPAILIETNNASIDTMAVTIRSLHVNSKQMTLAVFRQLPVFNVYHKDGTLTDVERWGMVRYKIGEDGDLWLVASKEGILYRGNVKDIYFFGMYGEWISLDIINNTKQQLNKAIHEYNQSIEWEKIVLENKKKEDEFLKILRTLESECPIHAKDYQNRYNWIREMTPERPDKVSDCIYVNDAIFSKWKIGIAGEYKKYINNYSVRLKIVESIFSSYQELLNLPQLFIAV